MAQSLALTRIIHGVTGDSDHLKTIINIWATACSIVFSGLLYFLGRWITADLVWHLQPMNTVRLEAGWGLRPGLFSIRNGLKLKTHFGLLLGVALLAIWGVSIAMHAWLIESVAIETYTQTSVPQPFVISRLQSMADSDSPDWYTGYYSDVSGYGMQAMIGWENRTQLHYEDGDWDIEATINPLKVDRLVLTRKTPVALRTEATIYVESAIMGLDSATKSLTNSETIMTPIQKWMSNTKNSASRLLWFDNITEGWLQSKTVECIAFMTTPITLVGETQLAVGNELVSTFILQTKPIYIIAGVSVQVALIALVIGVYLAKADKGKFYGDSVVSLIDRCGKDWELETSEEA
ncbi:hypothetical protein BGX24_000091 [Mortierella sp. AD032]|nr:hypothetical protein BGX24_000091 [Mortierella sp. AD032]